MLSKDEIIRMAKAAGFEVTTYPDGEKSVILDYCDGTDYLERFASLIQAHTQEQCAKVCDSEPERQRGDGVWACDQKACAAAIRAMK